MNFEQAIKIASDDKKVVLYVDGGTAYGELHDFLMSAKGTVVDRISQAQAEEEAATEKVKEVDEKKAKEASDIEEAK